MAFHCGGGGVRVVVVAARFNAVFNCCRHGLCAFAGGATFAAMAGRGLPQKLIGAGVRDGFHWDFAGGGGLGGAGAVQRSGAHPNAIATVAGRTENAFRANFAELGLFH